MSARVVHYVSQGTAMAFACYHADMRPYLDEYRAQVARRQGGAAGITIERNTAPPARRTTSLDKVTCPKCWGEIARLARDWTK